jgi:ABC-type phosphate transport system substrate-binding protein
MDKSHHIAIPLFLGTFLGSLFGVAAQLTAVIDAVEVIAAAINPSPQLQIVGSHTVLGHGLPLADEWREDFKELTKWKQSIPMVGKIERQVEVTVKDVGTHKGIEQAMEGKADLLVASAPIPDDKIKQLNRQGISIRCAAEIGYDVIVFITHLQNKVDSVSEPSIKKILKGEYTHWSDVNPNWEAKPIHVFVRPGSGTTRLILKAFIGSDEPRPHFIECPHNSACFNGMLGTHGSTYWVSSTWLYTQPSNYLHPFFIRHEKFELPQNPFLDDFKPDHYHPKMIRPLYMYVLSGGPIDPISSDLAKKFFEYVRGVQGQELLEKSHFYTYFDPPTKVKVELPEGFGPRSNQLPVVCK